MGLGENRRFWITIIISASLSFSPLWAKEGNLFLSPKEKMLPGLDFKSDRVTIVKRLTADGKVIEKAILEGSFKRTNAKLVVNDPNYHLNFDLKNSFSTEIILTGKTTPVTLLVVTPAGEVEKATFLIKYSEFDAPRVQVKKPPKTFQFNLGLGPSSVSYNQTAQPPLSVMLMTIKGSALYPLSRKWNLGLSAYYSLLPLSSNRSQTIQFLGINGRIGYIIFNSPSWRFSLMGGWYYTTTMVANATFGFNNLQGPQLFPVVQKIFANGTVLTGYVKFSPIIDGIQLLNLNNRELATGLSWLFLHTDKMAFSVAADISSLYLTVGRITIQSNSMSVSLGVGL